MWTFCHSAHNFEFLDEAVEAQRDMETSSDHDDDDLSLPSPPSSGAGFQPFTGAAHRLEGSTDPEQNCDACGNAGVFQRRCSKGAGKGLVPFQGAGQSLGE